MSNIEPTEEQKQAAEDWIFNNSPGRISLARLLAEREAKLRKQLAFMESGSLADYNAFAEALQKEDAYLAEINLVNERLAEMRLVDGRKSRMLYDRDVIIDTLRARVAELEAERADTRQELQMVLNDWNSMVRAIQAPAHGTAVAHAKLLVQRESQHLADIKALMADAFHRHVACVGGCSVCDLNSGARCSLLQRLAHYDDAKAAEGGEG